MKTKIIAVPLLLVVETDSKSIADDIAAALQEACREAWDELRTFPAWANSPDVHVYLDEAVPDHAGEFEIGAEELPCSIQDKRLTPATA